MTASSAPTGDRPASKSVVNVDPETGGILTEIAVSVSQAGGPGRDLFDAGAPIDVGQAAVWTVRSDRLYRVDPEDGDVENVVLEGGLRRARTTSPWIRQVHPCARGLFEVNLSTIEQEWVVHLEAEGSQFGTDVAVGGAVRLGGSDG